MEKSVNFQIRFVVQNLLRLSTVR